MACTCVLLNSGDWPFPKNDGGTTILFRGTVTARSTIPSTKTHKRYSASFRVHEWWRGPVSTTVRVNVTMSASSGDCLADGMRYEVGETYLVYAHKETSDYEDIVACVPVGLVNRLPKVMQALGTGHKPAVK